MGRSCSALLKDLYRFEQGRHVIFYQSLPGVIRILRVLHQQMLPVHKHFDWG
jgi:plasmid stabilization system protein ParE